MAPTTADNLDERLDRLFAADPDTMEDPWPIYEELRRAGAYRYGSLVILSSYADVKSVLRASRTDYSVRAFPFAGDSASTGSTALTEQERELATELRAFENLYVSRNDGDDHERLRRIAHRAFTPRRVADLRTQIQSFTDDLLSEFETDGMVDMTSIGYSLPLRVIIELLSAPPEDAERIHAWSNSLARGNPRSALNGSIVREAHAAMTEFRAYVVEVLERRPSDKAREDLVSALIDAEHEERLTTDELVAMFVVLMFAGHETTTTLLLGGVAALLDEPSQWQTLVRDPALAGNAVEELLRLVPPVQWIMRRTLEDVSFGDLQIEADTNLVLLVAMANRDEAAFADPECLDITRENARQHLSLGFGPHFCLGGSLARLEGDVVLSTLATRYPELQLVRGPERWTGSAVMRSPRGVLVRPLSA